MSDHKKDESGNDGKKISRRDFLIISGAGLLVIGVGCRPFSTTDLGKAKTGVASISGIPTSGGYLLVDVKKCQGCMTCMLACSLTHEGKENLSLARIQVTQNPFRGFPSDISIGQCRQCVDPACVEACEPGALFADPANGYIRLVDREKCVGCMACVGACPYGPGRVVWNFMEERAQKCDLCANTPFWDSKGGPDGKQACVELCPTKAITFTTETPIQEGVDGYQVNLRGRAWENLGYPVD